MKKEWIALWAVIAIVVLTGGGVLIWWLARSPETSKGYGDIKQHAAFVPIRDVGEMFYWYYPTTETSYPRPLIVWLHGVTDVPPSLAANIGAFGPYDRHLNRRNDSWVEDYNLLFIDAPLGTGFSRLVNRGPHRPTSSQSNAEHLALTLKAFFEDHEELSEVPVYVIGQGHGGQLAAALAVRLQQDDTAHIAKNLKGIGLGNPVIDPRLTLTKMSFYLKQLAYINHGFTFTDFFPIWLEEALEAVQPGAGFDFYAQIGELVNEDGATDINLRNVIDKATRVSPETSTGLSGNQKQLRVLAQPDEELVAFMNEEVAAALGVSGNYDEGRQEVVDNFKNSYLNSAVPLVEEILQNTKLTVTIYNGNLDAISSTPGQLEWVNSLKWDGQEEFLNSRRNQVYVNDILEGSVRETDRLKFYWVNAAGQSVPVDSPVAMRRILQSIAGY
ncbi:retinoid-inducible serine carboxypeptidase-like [Plutella xylostella]|uniref:retinoid-inducible serine carboxypeptidase-like n=1 Tax=Plutella xylostella TaxID=51655 RepID=UPI0020330029|nr:retinoid-inducible serine carboxypeptidase-like [Plutella xylostella]